jgi:hypothetical protein
MQATNASSEFKWFALRHDIGFITMKQLGRAANTGRFLSDGVLIGIKPQRRLS